MCLRTSNLKNAQKYKSNLNFVSMKNIDKIEEYDADAS